MDTIRAWATGLRSTLPWSIRGTLMSPTYRASPRSFSSASTRAHRAADLGRREAGGGALDGHGGVTAGPAR